MRIYRKLRRRFGFLDWWPGETKDEILIGAVLTQQTSWKNVEKAIANLRAAGMLDIGSIASAGTGELEALVRPSGFYRQKAGRLRRICRFIKRSYGSLESLFSLDDGELRETLLALDGIGKETADSIILYAAGKPTFVVDSYTRRAMARIMGWSDERGYDELKGHFESGIRKDTSLFKDMHAQFVELGKNYCKKRPLCGGCPLNSMCSYALAKQGEDCNKGASQGQKMRKGNA